MRRRPTFIASILALVALVALVAPIGPAAAQPGGASARTTEAAQAAGATGADADIRVEEPNGSSKRTPSMTDDSALDGSPLGWPLTLALILLAVLLVGYVPWRVRRAAQSRRATT
jgi:hypothetical protein